MFEKKKNKEEQISDFIEDNFDKCIVLAKLKNNKHNVVAVKGDYIDIAMLLRSFYEQTPQFRPIVKVSLDAFEEIEKEKKEKGKKNAKAKN